MSLKSLKDIIKVRLENLNRLPTYCEGCGVKLNDEGFKDEAKTVIWHRLCKDCENENNSEKPLDIKPE